MSVSKTKFSLNERVTIDLTTDPELDGNGGTIVGTSLYKSCGSYNVLLDSPHSCGERTVVIPEEGIFRAVDPID